MLFEFASLHKGITLDIRLLPEREITHNVVDGLLGMGIVTRIPTGELVRAHRLISENVVLVTSKSNKKNFEENHNPRFAGFSDRDPLLQSFLRKHMFSNLELPARIHVAVNSHNSMIEAVEALNLYAAMPLRSAQSAIKNGRIRIASAHNLHNDIYLVLPDHEFQEKRYVEATKFLIQKARTIELTEKVPQTSKSLTGTTLTGARTTQTKKKNGKIE
jgi:DNA-binding transcriptional LysR family regulator